MNKLTLTLIFVISTICVNAQIINFPDANLKNKLLEANVNNEIAVSNIDLITGEYTYSNIDLNFDGEIQTSEAQLIKRLYLINSNITNIEGINYFSELTELFIGGNNINNLNILNQNLKYLECSNSNINTFSIVSPNNLNYLSIKNNNLLNLNLTNLNQLSELVCSQNLLSNINLENLTQLFSLNCNSNQLTNLNLINNINLKYLNCKTNNLTTLDCSFLTSLELVECSNNPNLEIVNIKNGINNSGLTSCSTLTPYAPGFFFSNCPLLKYICIDDFEESCVLTKMSIYGYTNCNINSYCSFTPGGEFYTIQGQKKFDNENDGCDSSDASIPNLKYTISNETTTGTMISNNSGNYSIPVQAGTHNITPILENPSYFSVSPANVVVDFPTQASPFTQDFCITPNGNHHDVEVSIIPINVARPGFDVKYKIIYKNKGNQTENGSIDLQFDDTVLDVISTNPAFTTQTTNNLSFNYNTLNPFETREINVVLNVNSPIETPAVNAGDFLIYSAEITQLDSDELPIDNTFGLKQVVVNSYDPNDKTCLQGNYVSPDKIGEFVHYVIRFENTGTFPAENVVVKDIIDTDKFDISSLTPLNASHNYVTRISGNKVEFIFENINLPFDDATNDGYVSFKIKTLPSLVVGNTFSNSANIYFDYNFPIVTNTATTTIAALNNPSFEFATYFNLYPNPTTNELNINLKSAIEINSIQIYNTIGQLVSVQTGNALKVDVSNLKTGNYFIKVNTNEGFSTNQFIKE